MKKETKLSPEQIARAKIYNSSNYRKKIKRLVNLAKILQPNGKISARQRLSCHYFLQVLTEDAKGERRHTSRNVEAPAPNATPKDSVKV